MHKNKGNDLFKTGNYQAAIDAYGQAIEINSNEPSYFTNRCIAYLKIEEPEMAMNDCRRAIQVNEKFAKAYNRMAKCHVVMGDLQSAAMALAKSNELEPNNAVNKKDQKALNDLKINEKLVHKNIGD
jgi:DnaJ family protein C protein 7